MAGAVARYAAFVLATGILGGLGVSLGIQAGFMIGHKIESLRGM